MIASTMLRSTISKTKKRLSDDFWLRPIILIGVMALGCVLVFGLRAVSLGWDYGVVAVEMPVLSESLHDPSEFTYHEKPSAYLEPTTPLVAITADGLYFGDLKSFSSEFHNVRNKFVIRHLDGAPQLDRLLDRFEQWAATRFEDRNIPSSQLVVLAASGEIPAPIVIQVIAGLRRSSFVDRVVLAGGLL